MAEKSKKSLIVTVADDSLEEIQQVAERLRKKGMTVEQVLHGVGTITGHSLAAKVLALSKVRGVASVEEEVTAHLPPPGESPQ